MSKNLIIYDFFHNNTFGEAGLISTIMMETYWAMLAELVSEIYFAVGTQIYTKSNHDILTRKKLSLIFGRN